MTYNFMGRTGLSLSALTLGCQTFGWNTEPSESYTILDAYREAGGNYLDMADSYNDGRTETICGNWLKDRGGRKNLVLGTKVFFSVGEGPNDCGLSRIHIMNSVDESLRRLNTDYIDLLQIHCIDLASDFEDVLRTLDDLVRAGKVRYTGASNITPSQLMKMLMISRYRGYEPFSSLQLEYSLLVRSPEWELLPLCRDEGVAALAWSPLAGGWLTGKYKRESIPADSRAGRGDRWDDGAEQRGGETTWRILDVLQEISEETGKPVFQISLNWMIQRKRATAPLIGARTLKQLKGNLAALDWQLTEDQLDRIDNISSPGLPSPYSFISHYNNLNGRNKEQ